MNIAAQGNQFLYTVANKQAADVDQIFLLDFYFFKSSNNQVNISSFKSCILDPTNVYVKFLRYFIFQIYPWHKATISDRIPYSGKLRCEDSENPRSLCNAPYGCLLL